MDGLNAPNENTCLLSEYANHKPPSSTSVKTILNLEDETQVVVNTDWVIAWRGKDHNLEVWQTDDPSQKAQETDLKMELKDLLESADRGTLWQYTKGKWCWLSNDNSITLPGPAMHCPSHTCWHVGDKVNVWTEHPDDSSTDVKTTIDPGKHITVSRVHLQGISILFTFNKSTIQGWTLEKKTDTSYTFTKHSNHSYKCDGWHGHLLGTVQNRFIMLQRKVDGENPTSQLAGLDLQTRKTFAVELNTGLGEHRLWQVNGPSNLVTVTNRSASGYTIYQLTPENDKIQFSCLGRYVRKPRFFSDAILTTIGNQIQFDARFLLWKGKLYFVAHDVERIGERFMRLASELLTNSRSNGRLPLRVCIQIIPTNKDADGRIHPDMSAAVRLQKTDDQFPRDSFKVFLTEQGLTLQKSRSARYSLNKKKAKSERKKAPDPDPYFISFV